MSEQEKLAARDELLEAEAETSGLTDPPEVDLVRWIKPEEFVPVHVKCLNDAGFGVTPTEDGLGVDSRDIPRAQTTALLAAQYVCIGQYTVDPKYSLPLTDAQLGVLYDYLVEFYVPCVEELGYELMDPPTREVYIASPPAERWMPIVELRHLSQGQFTRLILACPDYPPSDVLYGS